MDGKKNVNCVVLFAFFSCVLKHHLMWGLRFVYLRFSMCLVICVISRTVNIAAFVSGIFDLFDGHFDGQNGYIRFQLFV